MKTTCKKSKRSSKQARKPTISKNPIFKCQQCKKYFRGQPSLSKHVKDVHTLVKQEVFSCELCGGNFGDRASIVKHIESHSKTPVCFCTLCNETFAEFDELDIHVSICRKTSNVKGEEHQNGLAAEIGAGKSDRDSSSSDNSLEDMIVKIWSREEEFVCEICGIKCQGVFRLTTHCLTHEPKETGDNKTLEVGDNDEDCAETRYDPDDQYWTHYSWDGERSLVYPKSCEEFENKFSADLTEQYQMNQMVFSDDACETVQLSVCDRGASDNKFTEQSDKSDQEFDPTEFHGWTSTGTSEIPGIAAKYWLSEPYNFEQFDTQTSILSDGTYKSSRWSACYKDQEYAMDTDSENVAIPSTDNFITDSVSNSEIETILGSKTISVQPVEVSLAHDCVFDEFISPSQLNDTADSADSRSRRFDKTFQCCHCQGWFLSETDLEEHIAFAHDDEISSPRVSQEERISCSSKQQFETSLSSSNGTLDDMSGDELKGLDLPMELLDYTVVEKKDDKKSCERCGERISVDIVHSCNSTFMRTGDEYKCRYCQKTFVSYSGVISHVKVHTQIEKPFKCDKCPRSYMTKSSSNVHHTIHTGGKRECHICGKMVSPAFLNSHARSHNLVITNDDTSPVCDICGRTFQSISNLAYHQSAQHDLNEDTGQSSTTLESYKCPHCKEEMPNKPLFIAHVAAHTGVYPFECSVCTKGFLYREVLKVHMSRFHTDNPKKVSCEQCSEDFYTSSTRQRYKHHYSLTWSFVCEECGKGFRWRDIYESHMRMHKGQIPLRCDLCEKTFTVKRNWVAHQQIHADDKPYRCDQCNGQIRQKNSPTIQIKTEQNS